MGKTENGLRIHEIKLAVLESLCGVIFSINKLVID